MRLRTIMPAVAVLVFAATTVRAQAPTYRWDFTTDANASTGSAPGVLVGDASVSGGVLHLDGSGDYVDYTGFLVPTSGSYTVSLFARALGQTSLIEFISQGFSAGPGFYIGSDGGAGVRVTDVWQIPTGFSDDAIFHRYVLAVGSGTSKFFVDGTLLGTLGGDIATAAGGNPTRFGAQFNTGENFHGELDDIRLYERKLSDSEVLAISRDGSDLGATVATPEPGSLVLLATGMAGIVGVIRRRKHA